MISNTLFFQLLYPLLTMQHEPTFSGAVWKHKNKSCAPKQTNIPCCRHAPPSKKLRLGYRLQDGTSVPEPNQKLQNITATQRTLFYKEKNLSTSQPCMPSCAHTTICKAVLLPSTVLELSQSLQARNNPTKRYTDIGDERGKVACGQSSGSFSTHEKGLSNDLMDGSMLESQARVLCCWLGLAPVFHRRLLACHSPFSRDLSIDIIPWANLDTWEGQEVKQAAHEKKNHSLLELVLIKANGCKRFSEVLLLCHSRGWEGSRIHP